MSRMIFDVSTPGYIQQSQSITLDYAITINNLKEKDQLFNGGALGNFSLAGFELVRCDRPTGGYQFVNVLVSEA